MLAHHLEVLVQTIEPVGDPAEAALEEADPQAREAIEHTTRDDVHHDRHLSERVRDHVLHEEVVIVSPDREPGHAGAEAAVHAHGEVVRLRDGPQRIAALVVERKPVEALRPDGEPAQAQPRQALRFRDREVDVLEWHDSDPEQTVGALLAEITHPVVVRTAGLGGDLRIADVTPEQVDGGEHQRSIDALLVEHGEPGLGIVTPRQDVGPRELAPGCHATGGR